MGMNKSIISHHCINLSALSLKFMVVFISITGLSVSGDVIALLYAN